MIFVPLQAAAFALLLWGGRPMCLFHHPTFNDWRHVLFLIIKKIVLGDDKSSSWHLHHYIIWWWLMLPLKRERGNKYSLLLIPQKVCGINLLYTSVIRMSRLDPKYGSWAMGGFGMWCAWSLIVHLWWLFCDIQYFIFCFWNGRIIHCSMYKQTRIPNFHWFYLLLQQSL